MKILLVGALSWNPERVRSLHERGHQLWGLWSRSMAWDQGPYPAIDDCVTPLEPGEAAAAIRSHAMDCVYSLFQVYHWRLWGPPRAGIEHDVWTLLRALMADRQRGMFDVPIVRHWGFDVHNIDPVITRAFDGQVFCNREKYDYWTTAVASGGCGVDAFGEGTAPDLLDSDLPKREFMNDDFAEPLSRAGGDVHTVCVGRPFGIDYLAAAARGIHVHIYGNNFDDVYRALARAMSLRGAVRGRDLLQRFVHVHPSLQVGGTWDEVRAVKARWVREFSRYDAAWSYIGAPLPWRNLDDRAAIPNRLGTYVLAGLPVISDAGAGYYRHDELVRLGGNIDLDGSGYDMLRARLDDEVRTRKLQGNVRRARAGYSFDATIDPLVGMLERARARYFARPHRERTRFDATRARLVHFHTAPGPGAPLHGGGTPPAAADDEPLPVQRTPPLPALRGRVRNLVLRYKQALLARRLGLTVERTAPDRHASP
jgi:hypothetical protein